MKFMPQLNKGGKFVFGLSEIHENLSVQFPPQALQEYHLINESKIIIFTGSKITGGFCVTSYPLLSSSKLSHSLKECPKLNDCSVSPGTLIPYKGRSYSWLPLKEDGTTVLSFDLMEKLDLNVGKELLSIRCSDIAFTMGAKGPILERAYDYAGTIPRY